MVELVKVRNGLIRKFLTPAYLSFLSFVFIGAADKGELSVY